jgi:Tfp pilus assembly protein PilE
MELLIVVAIIVVLAGLAITMYNKYETQVAKQLSNV